MANRHVIAVVALMAQRNRDGFPVVAPGFVLRAADQSDARRGVLSWPGVPHHPHAAVVGFVIVVAVGIDDVPRESVAVGFGQWLQELAVEPLAEQFGELLVVDIVVRAQAVARHALGGELGSLDAERAEARVQRAEGVVRVIPADVLVPVLLLVGGDVEHLRCLAVRIVERPLGPGAVVGVAELALVVEHAQPLLGAHVDGCEVLAGGRIRHGSVSEPGRPRTAGRRDWLTRARIIAVLRTHFPDKYLRELSGA